MRAIAYVRVSTCEQDEGVQVNAIEKFAKDQGIEVLRYFIDKGVSGIKSWRKRPAARELVEFLEKGGKDIVDYVLVFDVTRLGRDMLDTISFFLKLEKELGVKVLSIKDSWTWSSSETDRKFFIAVFSWIAEKEWMLRKERQEAAWEAGKQKGRPPKITNEELIKWLKQYRGLSIKDIWRLMRMKGIDISYETLRRRVKQLRLKGRI